MRREARRERTAIVRWMRTQADYARFDQDEDAAVLCQMLAQRIEDGEHEPPKERCGPMDQIRRFVRDYRAALLIGVVLAILRIALPELTR